MSGGTLAASAVGLTGTAATVGAGAFDIAGGLLASKLLSPKAPKGPAAPPPLPPSAAPASLASATESAGGNSSRMAAGAAGARI